ncbi:MAG: DNA alkylation repair protein [Saprospiraceae bacterium]|nr:DNA alkylation repair protein [Candidatus Vicinibacter affinis]MBK7302998.1 DNA alkylation repair protein [Candidatus Vicinibacter affinis]MBK9640767.1 DNA alkylation repair protein [Candidatus Vicinibacter affinis]
MSGQLFQDLKQSFLAAANPSRAKGMEAYMRHQFVYYGIASPVRKEIERKVFAHYATYNFSLVEEFVLSCWAEDQREWKYAALDYTQKFQNKLGLEVLPLFEELIGDQSWWDTVDCIAPNILGKMLLRHPTVFREKSLEWIESDNFWYQRAAIILQLFYRDKTDFTLMQRLILKRADSKEFFIQKASGWALRQYSKTNPRAVRKFITSNDLPSLTRREGLRLMDK